MSRFPALLLAALASTAAAQNQRPDNQPFPPHRVIGNVYYVGASDIASFLIATPAGHILVNSGYEDTPPIVRDGIVRLGFKPTDVRILLNSQAHFDHVAGQAEMQRITGAKIYSSEREVAVLESGGKADPRWGREYTYPAVKVDRVVRDLEEVTLGGVTLVAHLTPGHSMGCTTWTLRVPDAGKVYDVVIVGGTTVNSGVRFLRNPTYPGIADDYARTFRVLRALPCDVFLGSHGVYYRMAEKYRMMQAGAAANPFIDPEGYRAFVNRAGKDYLDLLSKEAATH
jgi:metallo-beta-lactamase class B